MARVVIVGGGVLGTMHALMARRRDHTVVHLDADLEPRKASVRNFGLVWVSGRAVGAELTAALRARELWGEIAADAPGVGLRPDGSLTLVQSPEELAVLEAVCARDDAGARGFELLAPDEVRRRNPALRGTFLAGLYCAQDAIVEPGRVLPSVRAHLEQDPDYRFLGGRTAIEAAPGRVRDHTGAVHEADVVLLCPGAMHTGVAAPWLVDAPLRRCRLQMLQTEPLGERLTTALADGDSLRYYPAFAVPQAEALPPPLPVVAAHGMQLLVSQRATGALTVGDTHAYDEPFDFALEQDPYDHLLERLALLLGRPAPPVRRRWAGVYSQAVGEALCVRVVPEPGLAVVTGPGGRGMTLSPALAEQTCTELGL